MRLPIDPLRARMLTHELERIEPLAERGTDALLAHTRALAERREGLTSERDRLLADLAQASEARRRTRLEAWLDDVVTDPMKRRRMHRAIQRGDDAVFDSAAVHEWYARLLDAVDRELEACLLRARTLKARGLSDDHAATLLDLAEQTGRWSRRIEALRLLVRWHLDPPARPLASTHLARLDVLMHARQPRWVRAAALVSYAFTAGDRGVPRVCEVFDALAEPDGFLVRAAVLRGLGATRKGAPAELCDRGARDSSVTVRLETVRVERRTAALASMAAADPSSKVRALALQRLATRAPSAAVRAVAKALRDDASGLVVRTAASACRRLTRRSLERGVDGAALRAALGAAVTRTNLRTSDIVWCRDALLDVATRLRFGVLLSRVAEARKELPLGDARGRALVGVDTTLDDTTLLQVMAVAATDGHALGATRRGERLLFTRGEPVARSLWRLWHAVANPSPTKRQTLSHLLTRVPAGSLRAPPSGLAEATATTVPGERVFSATAGEWGRELPRVEDLLSACSWRRRPIAIASARGVTRVVAPAELGRRLRARFRLTRDFARWALLRQRSLEATEVDAALGYTRALSSELGVTLQHTPFEFDPAASGASPFPPTLATVPRLAGPPPMEVPRVTKVMGLALASTSELNWVGERWHDFIEFATWRTGGHLAELALYAGLLLVGWFARAAVIRASVARDRSSLALVMGGWGTRGKSGTERLKAALLQGLGFENLVKTTGCEAMVIHSLPGIPSSEVFLYRAYDKATVWEQREVLRYARRFGVRAFLWECMALQPDLVNLLQHQWMRDDVSTLTNAYPDHEDVQGPTGYDVASTLSEFVPTKGRLFSTERSMLPLFAEVARERGTRLVPVEPSEHELLGDDLLDRFGHQEHPANVALVARIARNFGVPEFVAVAEMADNVLADLGALKTFPPLRWRERTLTFTNGMGANDRAGTLGNYERAGLSAHDPEASPSEWVVTVVNNRADRVSRSEVFSRLLVEEVKARRHVLIGTNLSGLRGFLDDAVAKFLEESSPVRDLPSDPTERLPKARARVARAFANLALDSDSSRSLSRELESLGWHDLLDVANAALERPLAAETSYTALRAEVDASLPDSVDAARRPFLVESIARRRGRRAVMETLSASLETDPERAHRYFVEMYQALFAETLVPLSDPTIDGDAIIEAIADAVPPRAHARVIGIQNIKGTGLDFVYRWVSAGRVIPAVADLRDTSVERRREALRTLAAHADYGRIDGTLALEALRSLPTDEEALSASERDATLAAVLRAVQRRAAKRDVDTPAGALAGAVRRGADFLDAVRRRHLADRVMDDLTLGVISHATAAIRMRAIVDRGKLT